MTVQSKPIPALYVVYILRSTVRHASLYIGSTPHPPRRLSQHNGKAKGGAARTSRNSLRPWEMVGVVSGFPSMVGALKFEWALDNPHLSLHIPPEERLSVSTQRKRDGQLKRPPHSISSILSNLHLLLRVPSFARWPLTLRLFDREVYVRWAKYLASDWVEPLRATLDVVTDFKPAAVAEAEAKRKEAKRKEAKRKEAKRKEAKRKEAKRKEAKRKEAARKRLIDDLDEDEEVEGDKDEPEGPAWGIRALPLDYTPLAPYLEKGQNVTTFEREGNCVVCLQHLEHDKGLFAICPDGECEGMGHVDCWSRHLLHQQGEEDGAVLPVDGRCPKCSGPVKWGDMMRELTMRTRGQKEVEKVLKRHRRSTGIAKSKANPKGKAKAKAKADASV